MPKAIYNHRALGIYQKSNVERLSLSNIIYDDGLQKSDAHLDFEMINH